MLVSFVISYYSKDYQGEAYLAETIQACLNQTYPETEVIIVDDNSVEHPDTIMKYFAGRYKNIQYHCMDKNHGNAVAARNKGTELAQGKIILPNDHDDPPISIRAEETVKHFTEYPDTDCFHGGWNECNVWGQVMRSYAGREMSLDIFKSGNFAWHHASSGLKKSILIEIPYREDIQKTDDYCLLEDWLNAGKIFRHTETVLGNQRRLPWGIMAQRRAMMGMPPNWAA